MPPSPAADSDGRRQIADAFRDAALAFPGRLGVCGVGLTRGPTPRIVFLLAHRSDAAERALSAWAIERGVAVEIRVAPRQP